MRVTNDEVKQRLGQLGREPVADPSAAFVCRLEQRLRTIDAAAASQPPAPTRRPRRVVAPAFAAIVVVVAVALGILLDRNSPSDALALRDPVNVEVVLPDGRTIPGVDGLALPDGTRLVVGAGGSARVGDRLLAAGEVALVDDGSLRVVGSEPLTTRPPTTSAPPTEPPVARAPDATAPAPTEVPVRTAPPPVESTRPPMTTTTEPTLNLDLQLTVGDGRKVTLRWRVISGAARYVVVRTTSTGGTPAEPSYPAEPPTELVATTEALEFGQEVAAPIRVVRYRVVALDREGSVIARSRFVEAELPR